MAEYEIPSFCLSVLLNAARNTVSCDGFSQLEAVFHCITSAGNIHDGRPASMLVLRSVGLNDKVPLKYSIPALQVDAPVTN